MFVKLCILSLFSTPLINSIKFKIYVIFRKWLVRVNDINTRGGVAPEWAYVNYEYKPFSKYFVSWLTKSKHLKFPLILLDHLIS